MTPAAWIQSWSEPYYAWRGYYLLPLAAALLVVARSWLHSRAASRRLGPVGRRRALALLMTLAVVAAGFSALVYSNFFNYHYGGYVNTYEFFHYYMGSKYAPEVGYFDLYNAALIADEETGRLFRPPDNAITDLRTYKYFHVDYVRSHAAQYRGRFSVGRWIEFVEDVQWFKQRMGHETWNRVLRDKGYNATPAWTVFGGVISNAVGTEHLFGLSLIDVLLLLGALVAIGRSYDAWTALVAVMLLASMYMTAHPHLKGAFVRSDFIVALLFSVCAMRTNRPGLAGGFLGWATMSRLFPAAFLVGPVAHWAWRAWRTRRLRHPATERFFAGFGGVAVLLFVASTIYGGSGVWSEFRAKIALHRQAHHMWNVGLPAVTIADFDKAITFEGALHGVPLPPGARQGRGVRPSVGEQRGFLLRLAQLAALVATFVVCKRLTSDRMLTIGFVAMYALVAPTYYYYIVSLLALLFFAARGTRTAETIGTVLLFSWGTFGHAFYQRWEQWYPTYFWISVLGLVPCLWMLAVAGRRVEPRVEEAPPNGRVVC